MSDAALDTARARLKNAVDEIDKLEADAETIRNRQAQIRGEIEKLNSFIATWYEMAGQQPPETFELKVNEPDTGARRTRPKNPDRVRVAKMAVSIIHDAGRPLSRRELFDQLSRQGLVINGKDPEMVLSTMLWREKDIIQRIPGEGYWPAGEAPPGLPIS